MNYPFNPTDAAHWSAQPNIRNAYRSMVPLAADGPGARRSARRISRGCSSTRRRRGCRASRSRALVSSTAPTRRSRFWDTPPSAWRFPFVVAFAFTRDETNHFADVLLPDAGDLESLQLIRIGGSKYIEQFWDHEGFALRQPAIAPRGQARDFTDIATDLAARCGLLEGYNAAINRGTGVPLKDFSLETTKLFSSEQIWDACKAASSELTGAPRRTASTGGKSTASPPSLSRAPPGTSTRRSRPRACASRCPTRSACCASAGSSAAGCTRKA